MVYFNSRILLATCLATLCLATGASADTPRLRRAQAEVSLGERPPLEAQAIDKVRETSTGLRHE